jgi:hypothetical protein
MISARSSPLTPPPRRVLEVAGKAAESDHTTGNNKRQDSRILGIHPTSLMRRLKKEQVPE